MVIKGAIFDDFINYKKPSMTIIFPYCSFKCDKECGEPVCQNGSLVNLPDIDIPIEYLIDKYSNDPISESLVCQGLEPFDSWDDLYKLIKMFREKSQDDIVIYTGYTEDECQKWINILKEQCNNIIIKFGRYIPNNNEHYDELLKVHLASNNQYAKRIS